MSRNCVLIPFGSHVGSRPAPGCESPRNRCACLTVHRSSWASGQFRPESYSAQVVDREMHGQSWQADPEWVRSVSVQRAAGGSCRSQRFASLSTSPAAFSCRNHQDRWNARRLIACAAQGLLAHRKFAVGGCPKTEGPENRHLLPEHHHPCRSRSHEEGNVDQCLAAGRMPDRDH